MATCPSLNLMRYLKMRPQPTLATRMTPIVRHGGLGTELAQLAEGGSMSTCDLCITSNNDNAHGSQAPGGRQQPPPGGNPRQANHQPPVEDLRR
jgi:hypothetical protein